MPEPIRPMTAPKQPSSRQPSSPGNASGNGATSKGLSTPADKAVVNERVYGILTIMFCCALIVSNVLAAKTLDLGVFDLPASILTFPVVYIVNDILSDVFGFTRARRTIAMGFVAIAIAAVMYQLAIALPGLDPTMSEAFATTLGSSLRILLASFVSYLCGSLLNSLMMTRLKRRFDKQLFMRCIVSTGLGETVDSIIFITVAFAGTFDTTVILTMIASQAFLKTMYEVIAYPVTRVVIKKVREKVL